MAHSKYITGLVALLPVLTVAIMIPRSLININIYSNQSKWWIYNLLGVLNTFIGGANNWRRDQRAGCSQLVDKSLNLLKYMKL